MSYQRQADDEGEHPNGGDDVLGPLGGHHAAVAHRLRHRQVPVHRNGAQVEDCGDKEEGFDKQNDGDNVKILKTEQILT